MSKHLKIYQVTDRIITMDETGKNLRVWWVGPKGDLIEVDQTIADLPSEEY